MMPGREYIDRDGCLLIKYPHGKMRIRLHSFFPCTAADTRKLMKVIALDDDRAGVVKALLGYLEDRYDPESYTEMLKDHANACVNAKTKIREKSEDVEKQQARVDRVQEDMKALAKGPAKKKAKEVLKAEKERLKALKEQVRNLKVDASFHNGQFIKRQAEKKRFETDISLIRELSAGWM